MNKDNPFDVSPDEGRLSGRVALAYMAGALLLLMLGLLGNGVLG